MIVATNNRKLYNTKRNNVFTKSIVEIKELKINCEFKQSLCNESMQLFINKCFPKLYNNLKNILELGDIIYIKADEYKGAGILSSIEKNINNDVTVYIRWCYLDIIYN